MRPSQQDRVDVQDERAAFAQWQRLVPGQRFIFVDESGVVQGMRLAYGWAPRGKRCVEAAPFRTGRRTSLLGWISAEAGEVVPFQGSVTKAVFERFVELSLVPSLKPGDVVVWDNASTHSRRAVELVEAVGASVVSLPRYSPELNPIELFWSKLKRLVRRAKADTAEQLRQALHAAIALISKGDVKAWMRHCGYNVQPTRV